MAASLFALISTCTGSPDFSAHHDDCNARLPKRRRSRSVMVDVRQLRMHTSACTSKRRRASMIVNAGDTRPICAPQSRPAAPNAAPTAAATRGHTHAQWPCAHRTHATCTRCRRPRVADAYTARRLTRLGCAAGRHAHRTTPPASACKSASARVRYDTCLCSTTRTRLPRTLRPPSVQAATN